MDTTEETNESKWDLTARGVHQFEIGSEDGLDEFLDRIGDETADLVNEIGGRPAVVSFTLRATPGKIKRPDHDE